MPKPQLASGLSRLKQASGQEPPAPLSPPTLSPSAVLSTRAPSRVGLVQIAGHFDPAVRKQLSLLAAGQDRDKNDLIAEALNDLFAKYKLSEIAVVRGEGSKGKARSR